MSNSTRRLLNPRSAKSDAIRRMDEAAESEAIIDAAIEGKHL
jgi:hypothetical protein